MAGNGQKTRQREKAICGLLEQPTVTQAAIYAGVSEGTLYRWLREDSTFQSAYAEARRECVRQATARLQRACSTAVQTLEEVMGDGDAPPSSRVTAARSVLELAFKAVEIDELDARITALEERTDR